MAKVQVLGTGPTFAEWEGLHTIGVIHHRREINGQVEEATVNFISSLPRKVRDITNRLRQHWGSRTSSTTCWM